MSKIATAAMLATMTLFAAGLSGCSSSTPATWSKGSGPVKVVTSTNVWGSVAHLVGGKSATVTAIISNVNQDPHSFEASARDQLAVNDADIVVLNGGGYDDFMLKLLAADPTPARVVNAFESATTGANDKKRNEHIWYSVSQVATVAKVIGTSVDQVLSKSKSVQNSKLRLALQSSMADFLGQLEKRKTRLAALKSAETCGRVFASEPLIDYLLADAGCVNVTPVAYSRAIEEERDVPPAVLNEIKKILSSNIDFLALNSSVTSPQIYALLPDEKSKIPIYGFGELLEQDPDTMEYYGDYLTMLDDAIKMVAGEF